MRVLILDDDQAVGQFISKVAQTSGYEVTLTTNGPDFGDAVTQSCPDVIVLDLSLADTDGIKQLRFLKSVNFPNPIILVSGFDERVLATTEDFAKQLALNIAGALPKPIRMQSLREIFDRLKSESEPITAKQVLVAVHAGELMLDYQPIVTRRGGAILEFEALVRWNHPKLGRLMPDTFIAVAEQVPEVMDALTEWVITTAVQDYARLRDFGLVVPIAVNLSGVNLNDVDFPDRLQAWLTEAKVPAGHFSLELTESAAFHDPLRGMEILSRLRLNGVRLAIDDFGTGYSSLKQLQKLPFSALKIDGSFVMAAASSRDALVIVKAIVALAQALQLECIAECVEDDATANMLESLGVDALQGYLIGRPMPARDILAWSVGRALAPAKQSNVKPTAPDQTAGMLSLHG